MSKDYLFSTWKLSESQKEESVKVLFVLYVYTLIPPKKQAPKWKNT